MKRTISALLGLLMLLSLCACGTQEAEPTPAPTEKPKPVTALDRWESRVEQRYNMQYEDFAEYWSIICDDYYGSTLPELLRKLSDCENVAFSMEEYNLQIADKHAEYADKYGEDWHFELTGCETEPLETRANEDFSKELQVLYDRISVLTNEASLWSDSSWSYFAEGLGCDVQTAKEIVSLYEKMGEQCNEAEVSDAAKATVKLSFGSGETVYETWIYKVDNAYVSQELIDNSLALINLIY